MTVYVRPPIPRQVFVGPDGVPFEYGDRWGVAGPPQDTYSVDSHPERFAPLHGVADTLVAHLVANYDVEVEEGDTVWADVAWPAPQAWRVVRAVRLTPANSDGAPLSIAWSTYPGVHVHAGVLCDAPFPRCGCDACDETVESAADALENLVLAVAADGFGETVDVRRRTAGSTLTYPGGGSSGWGRVGAQVTRKRLATAGARLAALPRGRWQPWRTRGILPPDGR